MTYDEIYSQFFSKNIDPTFFKYSKDEAYEMMRDWLHSIVAIPYVRKCFSSIVLDDELLQLTFKLVNSVDDYSDEYFVKDIFAQGLVICWMQQQVDRITNLATVIGGKDEKKVLDNYKSNMARLEELKLQLRKTIRDYGYINNNYIGEA